jgi:hypothetical protein
MKPNHLNTTHGSWITSNGRIKIEWEEGSPPREGQMQDGGREGWF